MTASLFRFQGLYSVSWSILILFWSAWFNFFLASMGFPFFPGSFKNPNSEWFLCHFHVQQLFHLSCKVQVFAKLFPFFHFHFEVWSYNNVFFLLLLKMRFGFLVGTVWFACVSGSQRTFCILFSCADSRWYVYHIQYNQIWLSCTVRSGSFFPPSRAYSFGISVPVCCLLIINGMVVLAIFVVSNLLRTIF